MEDDDLPDQENFLTPKKPDELREEIRERAKRLEREYLAQGKALYIVFHCEHHLKWGYDSFKEYVETETGDSVKQAERLRKVWVTLVKEFGVSQEDSLVRAEHKRATTTQSYLHSFYFESLFLKISLCLFDRLL